ncbi:MAG TPA: TlpA disulfide reductase family protein [Chitinophagaceae bacterium]|nr:TlpA disulfide reductase family protein [Chitinophagaceae bacterium]
MKNINPPRWIIPLLMCAITITACAQDKETQPTLNIGDKAPALQVTQWFKGSPVNRFEKGKVYVVEFWATWCGPCKAAMPRLSALARAYGDTVTFIGIDVLEMPGTTLQRVNTFVDSIGSRMDYTVAAQDSNFMVKNWMKASGADGIPQTFIINREGKLAWIGLADEAKDVLRKVVDNTWDVTAALAKSKYDRHLAYLDHQAYYRLQPYAGNAAKLDYIGQPGTILAIVDSMVKKVPGLKYTPLVGSFTFTALLKTNMQKALEYGKILITTSTYESPDYDAVIYAVDYYTGKVYMPEDAYRLALKLTG